MIATTTHPRHAPRELGHRASFWVAAAVLVHTLWTSAAPALTYPLYAAQWHLTPTVTTGMFAIYPIVVVAVLLLFGNLSDRIGRRTTMLMGLTASLAGGLLFALAPGVEWIFVGRALMGVGVGLSASPATAALVEFSRPGQTGRASMIATAATSLGLALATLVGGALIQYAPHPTHLNFWVLSVAVSVLIIAAWFLPRHAITDPAIRWKPGSVTIPKGIGLIFTISSLAIIAAYAHGALMLSLGAQIARDLIGSSNALVNGATMALFALVSGTVAVLAKRLSAHTSVVLGAAVATLGMGLIVASAATSSLPLFLASATFSGGSYSLMFLGGLGLISAHAPAHQRVATISAVYLIGYLMMGSIALSLGLIATAWTLQIAIDVGAPAVALLGVAAATLVVIERRPAKQMGHAPIGAVAR